MFNKSVEIFPIKENFVFLNSCGVSGLSRPALEAEKAFIDCQSHYGNLLFEQYSALRGQFYEAAAKILSVKSENISYVRNCAEGLCMIAGGYPFTPGDEVISYAHEYPSDHYPWKIQEKRGVTLTLLSDVDPTAAVPAGRPRAVSLDELEKRINKNTRVVALSHVQFTSGFAVDVEKVGTLCREKGVDLVIDAAQSLGALPLYPEKWNVAAVVTSGWKWLLGPLGSGFMYTSAAFRDKLAPVLIGPDMMQQGENYLDYRINPYQDGRKFEYSSISYALLAALEASMREVHLRYGIEAIKNEIFRLHSIFLSHIDSAKYTPVIWPIENRSGILSLVAKKEPEEVMKALRSQSVVCTARGGYLRVAPHFYVSDEEMARAAEVMNEVG